MANKEISDLTSASTLDGTELIHMVQGGNSRKGLLSLFAILGLPGLFTKAQGVAPVALTDAASIVTDASLSNIFTVTLGGDRDFANPTNLVAGKVYTWIITQDATGTRVPTFGSYFKWFGGGTAPTFSTAAGSIDMITGIAISSSVILCSPALDAQ